MRTALPCLILASALAAALGGCGPGAAPAAPVQPPRVNAQTVVAAPASEIILAELPASVVQPPGARVAVATPFAGLVRSVHVQPGQVVRKGQLLAVLVSRDAMSLATELARAEEQRRLTAAEAQRMAELARAGIVAGSRADSAASSNREADIAVTSARTLLAHTGASRDGQIRLTAPIGGRIASMNMDAGSAVDGTSAPIVIEAEGSRWLALQVPERLAGSLRPGTAVVTQDGRPGRLETVATTLDPATRSFAARARLDDKGAPLVSGSLLRLMIKGPAPAGAVRVPAAALVAENGRDGLFVKRGDSFEMRAVTRAGEGDPAVITAGLRAGETVAVSNLPELRAAARK